MKATVAKVTFVKEFQGSKGTGYSWHVTMDNGDMGETATQKNEAPWNVGDEAEYNREEQTYGDKTYVKLKKVYQQGGGFKGGGGAKQWTPDPEKETRKERWAKQILIGRQACLNTAASLISAGAGASTVENLTGIAEQLENWVKRGMNLAAIANPPAAPKPAEPAPVAKPVEKPKPQPVAANPDEDDLPF